MTREGASEGNRPQERWRLISEAIVPLSGSFDSEAMSRGEPGLPSAFRWRKKTYRIEACDRAWKVTGPEPASRERYVRRHQYRLRMEDGSLWEVYVLRQPTGRAGRGNRWFLYKTSP